MKLLKIIIKKAIVKSFCQNSAAQNELRVPHLVMRNCALILRIALPDSLGSVFFRECKSFGALNRTCTVGGSSSRKRSRDARLEKPIGNVKFQNGLSTGLKIGARSVKGFNERRTLYFH